MDAIAGIEERKFVEYRGTAARVDVTDDDCWARLARFGAVDPPAGFVEVGRFSWTSSTNGTTIRPPGGRGWIPDDNMSPRDRRATKEDWAQGAGSSVGTLRVSCTSWGQSRLKKVVRMAAISLG